jgi:large subunit ribosomal protein L6
MSRLGKSPIPLPDKVEVKITEGTIHVKGPKGSTSMPVHKGISVKIEGNRLHIVKDEEIEMPKTAHGLHRALINNMVIGVSKGF